MSTLVGSLRYSTFVVLSVARLSGCHCVSASFLVVNCVCVLSSLACLLTPDETLHKVDVEERVMRLVMRLLKKF